MQKTLNQAIQDMNSNVISQREAAAIYGIPRNKKMQF